MSLQKKLTKLRRASWQEIFSRARDTVRGRLERRRHARGRDRWSDADFRKQLAADLVASRDATPADATLLEWMRVDARRSFFFAPADRRPLLDAIGKRCPEIIEQARQDADAVCRHEFRLFEATVRFDEKVRWHDDPLTGRPWPVDFYLDLSLKRADVDGLDVKYVWELNRHQFLIPLAKAYWLTGEEKYAEKCFELVEDWIDATPYKQGASWASALEVAFRSISWLWCYHFLLDSPRLASEFHRKWLTSFCQHAEFLENHLSFFFSPYNHLIGELSALYMLGEMMPVFRRAPRWRDKAWKHLASQSGSQFHADGGTVEQSTFYHHATLGFYLLASVLRQKNGAAVSPSVLATLENAVEYTMLLLRPDGTLPMTGDIDSGRSLLVGKPSHHWDFRAFLAIGAVLFERGDMKEAAGDFSEDALWLLGCDGWKRFDELVSVAPAPPSVALRDSGYFVFRSGWHAEAHYSCFDCGVQAHGIFGDNTPSAAHGHADCLALDVAAHGVPFLVDAGFHTYFKNSTWSDAFRKTRAHNTVELDGRDQAQHLGGMDWCSAFTPRLESCVSHSQVDFARGSHDGYARVRPGFDRVAEEKGPVIHRRSVCFRRPSYWLVRDELLGHGEHEVVSSWHLAPGIDATADGFTGFRLDAGGDRHLRLMILDAPFASEVVARHDDADPDSGWVAPGYGLKEKAAVLRFRTRTVVPCVWHTLLIPYRQRVPEVTVESAGGVVDLALTTEALRDEWLLQDGSREIERAAFVTDAGWLNIRRNEAGSVDAVYLLDGTRVSVREAFSFEARQPLDFAAIQCQNPAQVSVEVSPQTEYGLQCHWTSPAT